MATSQLGRHPLDCARLRAQRSCTVLAPNRPERLDNKSAFGRDLVRQVARPLKDAGFCRRLQLLAQSRKRRGAEVRRVRLEAMRDSAHAASIAALLSLT